MTRILLGVLIGMLLGAGAVLGAAPHAYLLAIGKLTANDQEKEGCMFAIGNYAMLMLHKKGEYCLIAKSQIGATGSLMFVMDDE